MYIEIPDFLSANECEDMRKLFGASNMEDGLKTARSTSADIKKNEQAKLDEFKSSAVKHTVIDAISRCQVLQAFACPSEVSEPILSRYIEGMYYGRHLDNPFIGSTTVMRSDLSMTVFLQDAETYEGGALLLDTDFGEIECKLPAGHAVCYSTLLWHQVEPVRKGERLALVTWLKSRLQDPSLRALYFDASLAMDELAKNDPGSFAAYHLKRATTNMMRLWGEC